MSGFSLFVVDPPSYGAMSALYSAASRRGMSSAWWVDRSGASSFQPMRQSGRPEELAAAVRASGLPAVFMRYSGEVLPDDFFDVLLSAVTDSTVSCLSGARQKGEEYETIDRSPGRAKGGPGGQEEATWVSRGSAWAATAANASSAIEEASTSTGGWFECVADPSLLSGSLRSRGVSIVVPAVPSSWRSPYGNSGEEWRKTPAPAGAQASPAPTEWHGIAPVPPEAEEYDGPRDPFIVSLTSMPDRIANTHLVVKSLLDQEVPAEKVVLYLSDRQFPGGDGDLPADLLSLKGDRFEIRYDRGDIRSYKKLIPVMDPSQFPGMGVITADDDMVYRRDFTRILSNRHHATPGCICGNYFNPMMLRPDGLHHSKGDSTRAVVSVYAKMGTGAGMYFQPGILDFPDFTNRSMFMSAMPTHDELWVWLVGFANSVPFSCTGGYKSFNGMALKGITYERRLSRVNPGMIVHYTVFCTNYCRYAGCRVRYEDDPLWPVVSDQKARVW